MKKILATIILTICLLGLPATTFADATSDTAALKNMQFDVTKHLNLGQACSENTPCPTKSDGTRYECKDNVCVIQNQSYFGGEGEGVTSYPVFRFILDIIDTLTKIAGTIAVIMLILTGFLMMFSQGNQNTMEKAKQMFLYEIIGMIAILLSYILITVVQSIFTL